MVISEPFSTKMAEMDSSYSPSPLYLEPFGSYFKKNLAVPFIESLRTRVGRISGKEFHDEIDIRVHLLAG